MRVKLNSLFVSELSVYYVTYVLKQGITIITMVLTIHLETRTRIYCKSV